MQKEYLATITILVEDRQANAMALNEFLTEKGHLVLARFGIQLQPKCIANCTGLITLVVEGEKKEIDEMVKKINSLKGILAKACVISEKK